jgi:hypothetical protein
MNYVQSPVELEQELEGMRLFSNYDPAFSIGGVVGLFRELQRYEAKQGRGFEQRMIHEAYDNLTCRLPGGQSMYIRAPELITAGQVVLRNWQTLKDKEVKRNVEKILRHAERCRAMNEESLKEAHGTFPKMEDWY